MNNKLPFALFAGFIFWVGFLVASIDPALAAEGDLLLFDNFNDGNLNGWTVEYGNWYVNPQGNLAGSNSGLMLGGKINTGNSEWDNYRIDLDMNGFQGIDSGVRFRYTPNGNSYQLDLKYSLNSSYNPQATLRKTENGTTTILGDTHSITLQNNTWYHLKIEASNDHIKIWIHNDLVFDITDTGTKVKKGTLALNYWTGSIGVAYMKFDNVAITALAPPPPPRLPVIFIPGIGGSEFKAAENIFWVDKDDGHYGKFNYIYPKDEKVWVNEGKAGELGEDDYFDVLRLKNDGITAEASLALTEDLTFFGYSDINSFFADMGYIKGINFFVFPYDWRKDIRTTKDSLDTLIETAKIASGQSQVNLVVHSMGGLVARYYISDTTKASKVNKLIELGVPHLGAVDSLKTLRYGSWLGYDFRLFHLGISPSETRDIAQNLPSIFELLPSSKYYNFYSNTDETTPFPYNDDRDIDNNSVTGSLNFNQTKTLLSNLKHNMTTFGIGEEFHALADSLFNQTNNVKVYEIVGSSQPTLGQIRETWWIIWPINFIPKTDEIFINGDGTVPLYSASLKNDFLDISGAFKIYYVEQKHSDLVTSDGIAMQTVKAILNDDNALPVEVKDQKIALEGQQISLDDGELDLYDDQNRHCGLNSSGELEENIPDVTCTASGNTKNAFVKKKVASVKVTATRKTPTNTSKTVTLKTKTYAQDKIIKTTIYKNIVISTTNKIEFILNPGSSIAPILSDGIQIILATSEATGSAALDQTPPTTSIQISGPKDASGIYTGPVIITLTGTDTEAGLLKIEYSLDNGQTVQTYTGPFIIATPGINTLQIKSIDKLGNEEIPQTVTIEIAIPLTPSPSPSPSPTPTPAPTESPAPTSIPTPSPTITPYSYFISPNLIIQKEEKTSKTDGQHADNILSLPTVLGVSSQNPPENSNQTNINKPTINSADSKTQNSGVLILILGGITGLLCLGLLARSSKPSPKQMNYPKP